MSASQDGSGWYYMSEIGDTVRVYFPTKHTKDAIALSAVSNYEAPSIIVNSMSQSAPEEAILVTDNLSMERTTKVSSGATQSIPQGSIATPVSGVTATAPNPSSGNLEASNVSQAGEDKMADPEVLYLSTIQGKEVRLTPSGIEIRCKSGMTYIKKGNNIFGGICSISAFNA